MVTPKKTTTETAEKPVKAARAPKATTAKPAVKKAVKHETVVAEAKAEATPVVVKVGGASQTHKVLGRRKEATARVWLITNGTGKITVNGKAFEQYFTVEWHRQTILAPLIAVGENGVNDISVKVEGGGVSGQADAVRHGVARALLLVNPDYRKTLRRAGHLTRDPRAKERKKPGLKRARKRGQWAKR